MGDPVTVVRVDAADLRLPRRLFRVVANPPYGITQRAAATIARAGSRLNVADVVVQHAVARRWANGQGPGCRPLDASLSDAHGLTRSSLRLPAPAAVVDSTLLVVRRA